MRIILARHAETTWNVKGRYQGQSFDIPLSEQGKEQARHMAARLIGLPLARRVSSPLLRARQTLEAVNDYNPGLPSENADLMEINHGDWEGRSASEVALEFPAQVKAWRETPHLVTLPGGEGLENVQARAWRAFKAVCEGLQEEDSALIVGHDGVNRTLLCKILGLPLSHVWRFRQAPTCLNLLEGQDIDNLALVRLNDASHLFPLFGETVHRRL